MPRILDNLDPIYRGDTRAYKLTFVDASGDPVDVSGHAIWFTMKAALADADPGALQEILTVVDGSSGTATITIPAASTNSVSPGRYFYDFQWVTDDDPPVVTTVKSGTVTVAADTTRAIGPE